MHSYVKLQQSVLKPLRKPGISLRTTCSVLRLCSRTQLTAVTRREMVFKQVQLEKVALTRQNGFIKHDFITGYKAWSFLAYCANNFAYPFSVSAAVCKRTDF